MMYDDWGYSMNYEYKLNRYGPIRYLFSKISLLIIRSSCFKEANIENGVVFYAVKTETKSKTKTQPNPPINQWYFTACTRSNIR